jgi:16S rRNA (uracil1498-N3)-methyltransferase
MQRPRIRLFVDAALHAGAGLELSTPQVHYLNTVMRARPGESVALFNGRDGEWLADLLLITRKEAALRVGARRRPQASDPDVWLLFAPLKKQTTDFVVEKATELGARVLWPVMTRHTNAARVNTERLTATAIEAAEQCERLTVPEVREAASGLDAALANWDPARRLYVMDETGGGAPIHKVLGDDCVGAPAAILCGPEGGFAKSELDLLHQTTFVTAVGLGPRILRAETAALAALTCWQALCGDWNAAPGFRS